MAKKKDDNKGGKKRAKKLDKLANLGRRARDDPRMRHFERLGWTLVLVPLDLFESRMVARMFIGTWYGFKPDDLCELRARRIAMDGEPERTWWVMAIPRAVTKAKERPKAD